MNVYALFPLIATIAYIPLLLTTAGSRPWHKRHTLFLLFLVSAMLWSLCDYFLRSGFMAEHNFIFIKGIIVLYPLMAVQYHVFISTFYGPGKGRWLPFAYGSLALIILLVILGFLPEGVEVSGAKLYPVYGKWIVFIVLPLITLLCRTAIIFWKRLKNLDNPVVYNQIFSLMLGLGSLTIFTVAAILPWGREYPISHFGNLFNAFILSYAVIRHRLVDIRLVLRQGTAWFMLGIIGLISFWLLLVVCHIVFDFQLDMRASIVATLIAFVVSVFLYKIRGYFFEIMTRAFQGQSYDYRQKLIEFTNKIHNIFSLKEQGGELLSLLIQAINIKEACLLFPEVGSEDFRTQFDEPKGKDNQLTNLRLRAGNPIIRYLEREQKPLPRENLTILPAFLGLWPQEKEEIVYKEIEIFMPLISRDRLIAILVLGKKHSGRYLLEDLSLIEDVTSRVAVSIEKEYLREQLREREEELSVINSSSAIFTSSMDIQEIYGSFIEELKKVIDVSWASIVLADDTELYCAAISSSEGLPYQVGDKLPMEGTGTGWVVTNKRTFIEPDLSQRRHFNTEENFYQKGFRTVIYLPLIAKGSAIGSFIVASRQPNAYSQRQIRLLEQLASQMAMPLEHARLYAKAEKKARIDELTGLLNRRSLDEEIDSEISRHSRYGGVFSLAILDLDNFKSYNDSYGHLSGDKLLRQAGQVIKGAIRSADHAFRYGGDEFALLLPQTDSDAAYQVVERVREKVAKELDSGNISITTSIGLASWPDDGISHTDIIAAADVTLYRAKRSGGNQSLCASGPPSPLEFTETVADVDDIIDNKTLSVIYALSETVDSRCYYTYNHSKKVAEYTLTLAKALKLETAEMSKLEACALLHDVGKINISEAIMNHTGQLTGEEREIFEAHPDLGADIACRIPQLSPCADGIRHHHEWYDGSGYPDGLKGDDIPLEARILAIADAFTNMTSEKADSETLTHEHALNELKQGAGTQFDPYLVERFVGIYEKNITGTRRKARR
jgi:diguanylate cyclase (GGDEF)-like protein/putative nucleotidyltransferase with HDIG domain